jgi:small subunit ribosomal protein S8
MMTVVKLKYKEQTPVIQGIKQISKPGLRVYQEAAKLPKVLNGLGVAIISTSKGLLTDKAARAQHLGGEIVAYV